MHFSENPGSVRIDRFKESGKWYDTYAIDMSDYYGEFTRDGSPTYNLIHDAVRNAINEKYGSGWVEGWLNQGGSIVCLEPFHIHSHPIMLKNNR